ncbi:MAG TPA: hydrolase [Polyangiaceae bacterium]|nr:hydrolase [Polyangiaceae bacterium]
MSKHPREHTYRPAWWVPGAHAQTLWAKFARPRPRLPTRIERWPTPDEDFVDILRLDAAADRPRLFLLHGLEGTVRSHYVGGLFQMAWQRGWGADMLVFRSCGDEPNRARRFYHSGETGDLGYCIDRVLGDFTQAPLVLCGVSLGGNVLLKWLGEHGGQLPPRIRAAAAVSVPFDLERGSRHVSRGFSRIYERHFLRTLRQKAVAKHERFPDLFDLNTMRRARTLYEFDDAVTAPIHGFRSAQDYYSRSSSLGYLDRIRVQTLLLSARDDPFLPAAVLDEVSRIALRNASLVPEFHDRGGHVGFVGGTPWSPRYFVELRVGAFFDEALAGDR